MNCIWVNKWKKTQYRIQPHMDYNTATATNGLQTQVHKHMELEYKCICRYIWIWNGNVNAMIYDKHKVDITFVLRMDMYKH